MNARILALGLFVLAAAVGAVWFTWRPAAQPGGAEGPGGATAPRAAEPRVDLARPDGSVDPDADSARAADALPPSDSAASGSAGTAAASAPVDPGMPVGADQVTDGTRAFAEKYRDLGPEARRAALLDLESAIAERVEADDADPAGKDGSSLAELKSEAEWLRAHPDG